ncbi:hypothetical protein F5H01DRAFT_348247 [Linnemannia elongata]|nr:hypothetical protein F5H01DRAFT_348247 [Linnemannia elongata]
MSQLSHSRSRWPKHMAWFCCPALKKFFSVIWAISRAWSLSERTLVCKQRPSTCSCGRWFGCDGLLLIGVVEAGMRAFVIIVLGVMEDCCCKER